MCQLHVCIGIHAGLMLRSWLGTSISVCMVRVSSDDVAGEADDFAGERAVERVDANLYRIAAVDVADRILGHGQAKTQQVALRELDQRKALAV